MVRGGLREKLTLFWHDHVVTERDAYFLTIMTFQYVSLLRAHALGDFREFVIQVGIDPAMLVYLNGRLSTSHEPNENYARELLELFTMGQFDAEGQANYPQADIGELPRALTGWQVDYATFVTRYSYSRGDGTEKEIFGRRGKFDYRGVHDLIFEERSRQIADFLARKLYREFVYVTPNDEVVTALADILLAGGFEITPAVEAILSSQHFCGDEVIGSQVKSPVALFIGMLKELGHVAPSQDGLNCIGAGLRNLDQRLLDPPNVAGWPGHRTWISTSSLPARWSELEFLVRGGIAGYAYNLVPLAREILDSEAPLVAVMAPVRLAEHSISAPLSELSLDPPEAFAGDLESHPIPVEIMEARHTCAILPKS